MVSRELAPADLLPLGQPAFPYPITSMRSCNVAGCEGPLYAKGLCRRHYDLARVRDYRKQNATPAAIAGRKRYSKSAKGRAVTRQRMLSQKHRLDQREYRRTPNGRFIGGKASAKYRGIEWAIDKRSFFELISQPCFYCNGQLSPGGVGLDRIDPKQGYVTSNVVPACRICNVIKSDILTREETIALIALLKKLRGGRL